MNDKTNLDKQKLLNAILNASGKKINRNAVEQAKKGDISGLMGSLSEEERNSLKIALNDKSEAKKILSSKQAREIIKKLSGGQRNG